MSTTPPRGAASTRAAPPRPRPARAAARPALIAARLALVTVLVAAVGACTPREDPGTDATAASSPITPGSPGATTSAAAPVSADPAALARIARASGTPLRSGDLTLMVAATTPPVTVAAQDDGSVVLTFAVAGTPGGGPNGGAGPDADRLAAVLAAPRGLGFDVRTDRSVALSADSGAIVGAMPPATVVDDAGNRLPARLTARAADPALLDVLVGAGPDGAVSLTFGTTALVSAVWGEREGGRSLAVVPAAWVRTGGIAAQEALWASLVAAEPDAESTSMRDQLTCHAWGAPTKDSWNLEPWRPAVDSFTLLAARCNP